MRWLRTASTSPVIISSTSSDKESGFNPYSISLVRITLRSDWISLLELSFCFPSSNTAFSRPVTGAAPLSCSSRPVTRSYSSCCVACSSESCSNGVAVADGEFRGVFWVFCCGIVPYSTVLSLKVLKITPSAMTDATIAGSSLSTRFITPLLSRFLFPSVTVAPIVVASFSWLEPDARADLNGRSFCIPLAWRSSSHFMFIESRCTERRMTRKFHLQNNNFWTLALDKLARWFVWIRFSKLKVRSVAVAVGLTERVLMANSTSFSAAFRDNGWLGLNINPVANHTIGLWELS